MCNFLFIGFLLVLSTKLKCAGSDSSLMLTENFFVNLYSDPFLDSGDFSEHSKLYVDDKVEAFLKLMKGKGEIKHSKQKRSIKEKQNNDNFVLEGFKVSDTLENNSFVDAVLFSGGEVSYLASLEKIQGGDIKLGFYKYKKLSVKKFFETDTNFARKIYGIANNDGVFVVIVEYRKMQIYEINGGTVRKIQTLDVSFVSDVYLWNNNYGFFMAVARNKTHLGVSHIYKWFGKHFDLIDKLESFGATSIRSFNIGSSEFMAISNFEDEYGQKEVFSSIFKYNVDIEKYEINQKIATIGARSLAFSSFFKNGIKENFLIVINSKNEENTFHTCIIYKFVDNYFMPYESLALDNPEQIITISTPNKEQLIGISSRTKGLRIYSYDGWIFNEVEIDSEIKNINSIKTAKLNHNDVLLVNTNDKIKIIEGVFKKEEISMSVESEITNWCTSALKQINFKSNKAILGEIDDLNKEESAISVNREMSEFDDYLDEIDSLKSMDLELKKEFLTLEEINQEISNSFISTQNELVINHNLFIEELIINGDVTFDKLETNNINNISIKSILNNRINIESLSQVGSLQFENVLINNLPKSLNGKSINSLVNLNDVINMEKLIVEGNVTILNNTAISGFVNNEKISDSHIFINGINQTFEDIQIGDLNVNHVNITGNINNKSWDNPIEIKKLDELNVKKLSISRYINNVDIPTINKYALKLIGDQNFSKTIIFDTLIANEVNVEESVFEELLRISKEDYNVQNDFNFEDIEIDEINVINNLNDIDVKNGSLEIFRKDVEGLQEINGAKNFEDVKISALKNTNGSEIFIVDEVILDNVRIEGDLMVNNLLDVGDVKSEWSTFGLVDVDEKAFKLEDERINGSFMFPSVSVESINISFINNIPVNDFVQNEDLQLFTGVKTVNSDVTINGNTKVLHVNNVSLKDFEDNVLNIVGEQTLIGTYYINKIAANSVLATSVKLGNNSWEDVSRDIREINTTVNVDSLNIKKSHINNLQLTQINNINLTEILNNAVKNKTELFGNKTAAKIFAKNVFTKNEFNTNDIPHLIKAFQTNFQMVNDLHLREINVENINVEGYINDISGVQFKKDWTEEVEEYVFDDEYSFHKVTVLGKSTIRKNSINNLNLNDLFENTVKIDEDHFFEDVSFDEFLIVFKPIVLHGDIVGLDLDSAVTLEDTEQIISGLKTFKKMVLVNGSLELKRKINGMDMDDVCRALSTDKLYNLTIKGNAIFTKGLQIDCINGVSITELINSKWFKNQEANLTGYFKFGNIILENDVYLEGSINDIELENLASTYFSKSKNQTIYSHLDFTQSVNFFKGLKAGEMLLEDTISGIRLEDIIGKALLDDYIQIFDDTLHVDNILIQDLKGQYLLNDMDLQRQVMRYDTENKLLGEINTSNLRINNLIANEKLFIQDVNVPEWLNKAVMKNGGSLQFCNFYNDVIFSKELGVVGHVNDNKFNNETVLLKSKLQTVIGDVIFNSTNVYFKNLGLYKLNGIEFDAFIKEIVSNNKDIEIKSPVNINSPISTNNLKFKQLFNGVNVTDLLINLTSFNFENFHENYAQLLNVSKKIERSLGDSPNYLNHFELIQTMKNVIYADVFNNYLVAFCFKDKHYVNEVYAWDTNEKIFRRFHERIMVDGEKIAFVGKINMGQESYVYTEDTHFGYITKFSRENSFDLVEKLQFNRTYSLYNFQIVERRLQCVVFISRNNSNIYCGADLSHMLLTQTFLMPKNEVDFKVSSLIMNGETFLITSIQDENYVTIWQYNNLYGRFTKVQHIYVTSPCSISAISYKNSHYLAIASGHIEDAIYSGYVQIKLFHPTLELFVSYQAINVDSPKQVEFAILPSNELMLYVLTESQSESFFVYKYEGIFGFNLKSNINIKTNVMKFINLNEEHMILASGFGQLKIIRGLFKSQTYG